MPCALYTHNVLFAEETLKLSCHRNITNSLIRPHFQGQTPARCSKKSSRHLKNRFPPNRRVPPGYLSTDPREVHAAHGSTFQRGIRSYSWFTAQLPSQGGDCAQGTRDPRTFPSTDFPGLLLWPTARHPQCWSPTLTQGSPGRGPWSPSSRCAPRLEGCPGHGRCLMSASEVTNISYDAREQRRFLWAQGPPHLQQKVQRGDTTRWAAEGHPRSGPAHLAVLQREGAVQQRDAGAWRLRAASGLPGPSWSSGGFQGQRK